MCYLGSICFGCNFGAKYVLQLFMLVENIRNFRRFSDFHQVPSRYLECCNIRFTTRTGGCFETCIFGGIVFYLGFAVQDLKINFYKNKNNDEKNYFKAG